MTGTARRVQADRALSDHTVAHSRRGLHGRVVDELGHRVVSGGLPPGTVIDIDELVEQLRVSRTVIREVMKVLTAKGLLDARPRTGTFVLPRERWNLLDADVIRWRNSPRVDARLLTELEEVRQMIEPWGARFAAERATPAQLDVLRAAFEDLERHAEQMARGTTREQLTEADLRFHRAVLDCAGNELLNRLEDLLGPALRARDELAMRDHHHGTVFVAVHRAVFECIVDGRPEDAFDAMTALLRTAAADTDDNLQRAGAKQKAAAAKRPRRRTSGK